MRVHRYPMKIIAFTLAVQVLPLLAEANEAAASLQRFQELSKKSELITKTSSEQDVIAILGEPQSKGTGAWAKPNRKVWHYLSYTDDAVHRSFTVSFDSKAGCFVSPIEVSREEVEKSPLVVSTGTVIDVFQNYPDKDGNGFLCHVRFNTDGREFMIGVAVATLERVTGTPEVGASIRVEHRRAEMNYIFIGLSSLNLESISFKKAGEDGTGQPATNPESDSKLSDMPRPEAKSRPTR